MQSLIEQEKVQQTIRNYFPTRKVKEKMKNERNQLLTEPYYKVLQITAKAEVCDLNYINTGHSNVKYVVANRNKLNNVNYPFSLEAVECERLLFC